MSLLMLGKRALVLLCLLVVLPHGPAHAENKWNAVTAQRMPPDTVALISLWPRASAANQRLQLAPWEVITAAGLEAVGIDPLTFDRVDLMFGDPAAPILQWGVLLQSEVGIDLALVNPELLEADGVQNEGAFQYFPLSPFEDAVLHQMDANTVAVGPLEFVKQMLAERKELNGIAKVVGDMKTEQAALALVDIDRLRPLLQEAITHTQVPDYEIPNELRKNLAGVVAFTEYLALRLVSAEKDSLQIVLSAKSAADADALSAHFERVITEGCQLYARIFKSEFDMGNSRTGTAMQLYIDRLAVAFGQLAKPLRADNRLIYNLDQPYQLQLLGVGISGLVPLVKLPSAASHDAQSTNNMKQMLLAMHNFHDVYKAFPAAAGLDDEDKPMLSWRVAILPYLGEAELYQRFNLNEPWDSEQNKPLLEQMPDVFKHPSKKVPPGHTVYQAAVGEETLLRLKTPTSFRDIIDGSSKTIMLVETTAEAAVPWTAPQDFEVDLKKGVATKKLFTNGATNVGLGDGSVHRLPEDTPADVLKALFTRAGREPVNFPQ